ncbi:MAG: saccharopine dehydrogenase C-terminal domain-containing protein [Candidatus Caldarchaeum sp.]
MRVLVLGVGAVGEVIAKHLVGESGVSLTVADIDELRLRRIRRMLRRRVETRMVGENGFDELVKDVDLVINSAKPAINLELMRTCLRYGVNYMDLASDDIDEQLAMDRSWRRKEALALICMGEDPGLSNIYARYAADKLDRVNAIRIRDGEYSKSRKYPLIALFAPEIFFDEILSPSLVYVNGRFRKLPALSGYEVYEFPEPIGKLPVYSVSHEEVYTLPRFIGKGVRYVDFKLALADELINATKLLKRIGLLRSRRMRVKGASVSPRDVFFALMPKPSEIAKHIEGYASLVVEVEGVSKGKTVTYTIYTMMSHEQANKLFRVNATAYLTGTVPAVVASMIARGEIDEVGVRVPEQLDPVPIVERLARREILSYVESSEEKLLAE